MNTQCDIIDEYSVKCDFILNTVIFIDATLNISFSFFEKGHTCGYIPLNMHEHSPRLFRGEYWVNIVTKMTSPVNHTCSIFCSINKDQLMLVTNRHI